MNDKIAAVQIKYSCQISEARKMAMIIRAGKAHYAPILASMLQLVRVIKNRGATSHELLTEMHSHWIIENQGKDDDNDDSKPTEVVLVRQNV